MKSAHKFEVEDFASAFIRLEGGGTLILEAGWAAYRDEADLMDFTVYGTDGIFDTDSLGGGNDRWNPRDSGRRHIPRAASRSQPH